MNTQQLEALFSQVEALARAHTNVASARTFDRQRVRVACIVHYIAFDGSSVRTASGITRDISRSGLGFLTQQSLPKGIAVRVVLTLPDQKTVDLTGCIAYTRMVRVGWHMIGVHFGPVLDERLMSTAKPGQITEPRNKPGQRPLRQAPASR